MPYILNTTRDQEEMLAAIGAKAVEELFELVPKELRLTRLLDLPAAMGELELTQAVTALAAKNMHAGNSVCFLGGGSYDHFVPAVVDELATRGEFYTSYTPYQPEVSQGNLQAMFEYQTLICQLTGMDISNASLYEAGSSVAEAAIMCMTTTKRHRKMVTTDTVHPEYRQVLATYMANLETELVTLESGLRGRTVPEDIADSVDEDTSCVIIQYPNFFGNIEDVQRIANITHDAGAMLVVGFDPISLGALKRPGDLGADIVVAEGHSLGTPMSYGGPYLGILACRESFVRRMPGRIAGETVDRRGRRCWVLTLQTREQHIRREKATSNICTNQGLFALRASIYLASLGPEGLRETASLCLQKSHYMASQLTRLPRFEAAFDAPFFKEFVVRDKAGDVASLLQAAQAEHILAGIPLGRWYPHLEDCLLVCVTEKRTRAEIDAFVACFAKQESGTTVHA